MEEGTHVSFGRGVDTGALRTGSAGDAGAADPEETLAEKPPHRRLPPRRADDRVVAALSPHGGERAMR
jgi:hypothetical protein